MFDNVRQRFANPDMDALRPATFAVISRTQDSPGVQIMATAIALLVMVEQTGLDMSQVLNAAERALRDAEGPFQHHIEAVRDYASNELKRGTQ